jgi:hypothetical protein
MGTDHFLWDHSDITYKTEYQSETIHLGMEVQVTQHTGGDSDRWLLHELDKEYRNTGIQEYWGRFYLFSFVPSAYAMFLGLPGSLIRASILNRLFTS